MNRYMETQLRDLSEDGMIRLYEDVTHRIGSHVIGGNFDSYYIRKQEEILSMIQEEFERRKKIKAWIAPGGKYSTK